MQGFLDLYMLRARTFNDEDIKTLEGLFGEVIDVASKIYGSEALFLLKLKA